MKKKIINDMKFEEKTDGIEKLKILLFVRIYFANTNFWMLKSNYQVSSG